MLQDARNLTDERPHYAAKLRELADTIESSPLQPTGLAMQIFWGNGTATVLAKKGEALDLLHYIAVLERMKIQAVLSVNCSNNQLPKKD